MKKILKILGICLCCLSICFILSTTKATNKKAEYEEKSIEILGITIKYRDKVYFNGENNIVTQEQKDTNNMLTGGICIFLVIYWIVLLFMFEKEEPYNYTYENADDLETLKKYNPMVAGSFVDNRQVLSRDVTAVVLNLIQKDVLHMEMKPTMEGKENYTYMISRNSNADISKLDEIEKYILSWLFGYYEQEEIDLIEKLKEISRRKDFLKHLKKLDRMTQNKLNSIGANIKSVPGFIRKANIILLVIVCIMAIVHITNNGLNIHIYESTLFILGFVAVGVIIILPVVALIIQLFLFAIVLLKKLIKSQAEKFSGKKIVSMSLMILIFMAIFIGIVYMIAPNKYICLDIFMIGMALLIVRTDNLMTKHSKEALNDYYALQEIKYKISEYSLIKDEQINYIKLWDEYLIYAVAFGIPIQIVNKLKETHQEDEDIEYLLKCENLYYICKAYLEVMWDMEFKEKKSWFSVKELFKIEPEENQFGRNNI